MFLVLFVIPKINVPFWTKPQQCGDLDLFGIGLDTNLSKQIPKQMILWTINVSHALIFTLQFEDGDETHSYIIAHMIG